MSRNILTLSLLLTSLAACSSGFDDGGDDPKGDEDDEGGDEGGGDDGGDDGTEDPLYTDDDGDGYTEDEGDCDDDDRNIHPMAAEICNGKDDDCDGDIDDDVDDGDTFYRDADSDGYGTSADAVEACDAPAGYVDNADDCDDTEVTANPRGTEINWNDIDENCDGLDYDLDACVAAAVDSASDYMTDGYWSVPDYTGTYKDPVIGTFDIADWQIANQWLYLTEVGTTYNVSATDDETFNVYFDTLLGMNDSFDGFWIDVSTSWLAELAGINYDAYCDGYVAPGAADFDGTFALQVNATTKVVTGTATLNYTRATLTQSDVVMTDPLTGGLCDIAIFDLVMDYAGFGDTLGIVDDAMENTATLLVSEYENQLEAAIQAECSGN